MTVETFGIEKEFMHSILDEIRDGKAQLPEFQRDWVWPDRNVISLLASVSLAYPVGTIMMLRTGGEGVRFKQRPVQEATPPPHAKAERLILDGQQRLTSLFQSLMLDGPIKTQDPRKKPIQGWMYVNILEALDDNADREEAIRLLPVDRIVRTFGHEVVEDYSTPEKEYEAHLFPLNRVFDSDDWEVGFLQYWDYDKDKQKLWHAFRRQVIDRFKTYQLPVIELGSNTDREAVCQVFEKVNTGGVTLTVFELLTATFAADEYDLRKRWDEHQATLRQQTYKVIREFSNTDFLQAITLLTTYERRQKALKEGLGDEPASRVGCKRQDMLNLRLTDYRRWEMPLMDGLKRAAKFLHTQSLYEPKFLPYGSQLVPLAAILAMLGTDADKQGVREKLAQWYWCGVFGELYGGTTETRFSRDLPEVLDWVNGGPEPRTVTEALFSPARLLTLRTRGSAAYKGIYALLLREGAREWRSGDEANIQNYFDDAMDIHHIFPKVWCESKKIAASRYDSVVNKTPLAAYTNRSMGGRAPSEYTTRVANGAGIDAATLDANIATHLVDPALLRTDDFEGFFAARSAALLSGIEKAMVKPVAQLPAASADDEETYEQGDEDDDDE